MHLLSSIFSRSNQTRVINIDLPFYFSGQLLDANFKYEIEERPSVLGEKYGYQHIWTEAKSTEVTEFSQMSWLDDNRFYTISSVTNSDDQILLNRTGANDPDFNLRRDPMLLLRRNAKNTVFVSTIESHGSYSPVSELSENPFSEIKGLEILVTSEAYTFVQLLTASNQIIVFGLSNIDSNASTEHTIDLKGKSVNWTGPVYYKIVERNI